MSTRKTSRAARPISDFHLARGDRLLASCDNSIVAIVESEHEFRMPPQPATGDVEIIETFNSCTGKALDHHWRVNKGVASGAAHVNRPMYADAWKVEKDAKRRSIRVYGRAVEYAASSEGQAAIAAEREAAERAAAAAAKREKERLEKAAKRAEKEREKLADQQAKLKARLDAVNSQLAGDDDTGDESAAPKSAPKSGKGNKRKS